MLGAWYVLGTRVVCIMIVLQITDHIYDTER